MDGAFLELGSSLEKVGGGWSQVINAMVHVIKKMFEASGFSFFMSTLLRRDHFCNPNRTRAASFPKDIWNASLIETGSRHASIGIAKQNNVSHEQNDFNRNHVLKMTGLTSSTILV